MRVPREIKPHLSIEKMFQWLQDATDQASYKRRMAIWLTHTGKMDGNKVAEVLGVSVQAVWLWIRQYNTAGPNALERKGRGGRRWAFMDERQEAILIKPFIEMTRKGNQPKTAEIKKAVEQKLNIKVSKPYIYRFLARHRWAEIIAQSKEATSGPLQDDFRKLSRPWMRDI